jgi:hypothetical protein
MMLYNSKQQHHHRKSLYNGLQVSFMFSSGYTTQRRLYKKISINESVLFVPNNYYCIGSLNEVIAYTDLLKSEVFTLLYYWHRYYMTLFI